MTNHEQTDQALEPTLVNDPLADNEPADAGHGAPAEPGSTALCTENAPAEPATDGADATAVDKATAEKAARILTGAHSLATLLEAEPELGHFLIDVFTGTAASEAAARYFKPSIDALQPFEQPRRPMAPTGTADADTDFLSLPRRSVWQ